MILTIDVDMIRAGDRVVYDGTWRLVVGSNNGYSYTKDQHNKWKLLLASDDYDYGLVSDDYDTQGQSVIDYEHTIEWLLDYPGSYIEVDLAANTKYIFCNGETIPQRWFCNVYEIDRCYGGPEEGSWYYDAGTVVRSTVCLNNTEARELRELLEQEYPHTGKSSSVIYDGGDYSVVVQEHEAKDYPTERPRYS